MTIFSYEPMIPMREDRVRSWSNLPSGDGSIYQPLLGQLLAGSIHHKPHGVYIRVGSTKSRKPRGNMSWNLYACFIPTKCGSWNCREAGGACIGLYRDDQNSIYINHRTLMDNIVFLCWWCSAKKCGWFYGLVYVVFLDGNINRAETLWELQADKN